MRRCGVKLERYAETSPQGWVGGVVQPFNKRQSVRGLSTRTYAQFAAMDVRQTIGWNLRCLRVARGLTQESLSNTTGIDRAYVGRIERGSENVTVATLQVISDVLGVHVSQLFVEVDAKAKKPKTLKAGRKPKAS